MIALKKSVERQIDRLPFGVYLGAKALGFALEVGALGYVGAELGGMLVGHPRLINPMDMITNGSISKAEGVGAVGIMFGGLTLHAIASHPEWPWNQDKYE